MNPEFLDYYHRELAFLREMGAEFAHAHPQVAGQLLLEAGRCEDPHVERLLEAFAFLSARIRKKIDDEYPEITDALLSVVYPHYQRPIPSMAAVQFVPTADATQVTAGHVVARGTELTTPAVAGGSPCRFRTTYPVTLWPVAVESASLDPDRVAIPGKPAGSVSLLRLGLRCVAPGDWAALEGFESLRFFLEGIEPVPTSLHESLFSDLAEVWVRGKAAGAEKTVVLPRGSVESVGFAPEDAVLPYADRSFPGYRLLQEFFAFPAKFLFFDLKGLARLGASGFEGPVEVLFFLRQPPRNEVLIRPDHFRLGCTPVVNLFPMTAEPIRLTRLRSSYPIVPKYGELGGYEVFSVDRVVSVGSYLEGSVEFQPFYGLRHSETGNRHDAHWFASRRPSMRGDDDGMEVDLSLVDPDFSPTTPSVETITAHVTCTNRDIPARLPFGGGKTADFQIESDAPVGRVRLLTRPTKTLRPPLGRSAQWRVISQLGLNHLSLIEAGRGPDALRELLAIHDFAGSAVTRKMIEGIAGVSSRRIAGRTGNRMGNTLSLGMEVSVQFDEEAYAGSGAFLMASVLERFLGAYVTINSFTQMVATSKQREGTWKRWPPRCGDRTLL